MGIKKLKTMKNPTLEQIDEIIIYQTKKALIYGSDIFCLACELQEYGENSQQCFSKLLFIIKNHMVNYDHIGLNGQLIHVFIEKEHECPDPDEAYERLIERLEEENQ